MGYPIAKETRSLLEKIIFDSVIISKNMSAFEFF
jgi:hypothetical protein